MQFVRKSVKKHTFFAVDLLCKSKAKQRLLKKLYLSKTIHFVKQNVKKMPYFALYFVKQNVSKVKAS